MKTNQILTRKMAQFDVLQRTKDGMFNATSLMKQWNEQTGERRSPEEFLRRKSTQEFIEAIIETKNLNTRNVVIKSKGRYSEGTWVHPLLFIDFAMWINPKFKVQVLDFVHDQLIDFRNNAGDGFRIFTDAIQKFEGVEYFEATMKLNKIVFGKHEKDIRNKATALELKELHDVQVFIANICELGYINTFQELLFEMDRIAEKKWSRKLITGAGN